jgi:hypothetical protein
MGSRVAHFAYEVGPDLRLLRRRIPDSLRGGLMILTDSDEGLYEGDVARLCEEMERECEARAFEGVVADFETAGRSHLEQFVSECTPLLTRKGLAVYTAIAYAHCCRESRVIVPCAPVSGSVRKILADAKERFEGRHLALEMERLARLLTLPHQGEGDRIDRKTLAALVKGRQVFFSQELSAHYFTYKEPTGDTRFVVYDDSQSLFKKMRLAAHMGISEGFLLYPEVAGIFSNLKSVS